tara:strand:- start:558 stop:4460 length:3903 start_codon:yes stop_codon:yes gene_type:complete
LKTPFTAVTALLVIPVTYDNNGATLTWTQGTNGDFEEVITQVFQQQEGTDGFVLITTLDDSEISYPLINLVGNTTYTFRVSRSAPGDAESIPLYLDTPLTTDPDIDLPTLELKSKTHNSASFFVSIGEIGTLLLFTYWLQYTNTDDETSTDQEITDLSVGADVEINTVNYSITLESETNYTFIFIKRYINELGEVVSFESYPVPGVITNLLLPEAYTLSTTAVGVNQIMFSWEENENANTVPSKAQLFMKMTESSDWGTHILELMVGVPDFENRKTTYNVEPDTVYFFKIRKIHLYTSGPLIDEYYSEDSNEIEVKTFAESTPPQNGPGFLTDRFYHLPTSPPSIKIVWDMGKDDGLSNGSLSQSGYSNGTTKILNYTLQYLPDLWTGTNWEYQSGVWTTVDTTVLTEMVVTGLNFNSSYRFRVIKNSVDIDTEYLYSKESWAIQHATKSTPRPGLCAAVDFHWHTPCYSHGGKYMVFSEIEVLDNDGIVVTNRTQRTTSSNFEYNKSPTGTLWWNGASEANGGFAIEGHDRNWTIGMTNGNKGDRLQGSAILPRPTASTTENIQPTWTSLTHPSYSVSELATINLYNHNHCNYHPYLENCVFSLNVPWSYEESKVRLYFNTSSHITEWTLHWGTTGVYDSAKKNESTPSYLGTMSSDTPPGLLQPSRLNHVDRFLRNGTGSTGEPLYYEVVIPPSLVESYDNLPIPSVEVASEEVTLLTVRDVSSAEEKQNAITGVRTLDWVYGNDNDAVEVIIRVDSFVSPDWVELISTKLTNNSYTVNGLYSSTFYKVRVVKVSLFLPEVVSEFYITPIPVPAEAVATLVESNVWANEATLSWVSTENYDAANVTLRIDSFNDVTQLWDPFVHVLDEDIVTYTFTGLSSNTLYKLRVVKMSDNLPDVPSTDVEFSTIDVGQPTLSFQSETHNSARFLVSSGENGTITTFTFWLQYTETLNGTQIEKSISNLSAEINVVDLVSLTNYTFIFIKRYMNDSGEEVSFESVPISVTPPPQLLHHYDFSTQSLAEQVSGVSSHTLVAKTAAYSGLFEMVDGEWWYKFNKYHLLQARSLPPMPTTGNYTTQMEFWTSPSDALTASTISILANWGNAAHSTSTTNVHGLVAGSDMTYLQVYMLKVNRGNMQFGGRTYHPPHTNVPPVKYINQKTTGLNGVVYETGERFSPQISGTVNYMNPSNPSQPSGGSSIPPTGELFYGHHVLTSAMNFDQEGDDLLASKRQTAVYIDNKLLSWQGLQSGMQKPMFVDNGKTIFQIGDQGGSSVVYVKHVRMYEGVMKKSMLDALPTAHPN